MFTYEYSSYIQFKVFDEEKIKFKNVFQLYGFCFDNLSNIIDIKNNRIILIVKDHYIFIIYNIKNKQIETRIRCNYNIDLIFFEKYMITHNKNQFITYSLPKMEIINIMKNIDTENKGIYKNKNGIYYIIYSNNLYEIKNKDLVFKENISFYDYYLCSNF